jgi:hypothetical protein
VNRSDRREQIVKAIVWCLALPICNIPYALQEWSGVFSETGRLVGLLAMVLIPFGILYVIVSGPRSLWKIPLCLLVIPSAYFSECVLSDGIEWLTSEMDSQSKTAAIPLIDALHRFRRDHGLPPETLEALVPRYFDRIPRTAYLGSPPFDFKNELLAEYSSVKWYLGGQAEDNQETGIAADDSDVRPALTLGIGQDGRVASSVLEHMPAVKVSRRFTRTQWRHEPQKRFQIAEDLLHRNSFIGMKSYDVLSALGPTDSPGWRLWIGEYRYGYFPEDWRLGTGSWEEGSR